MDLHQLTKKALREEKFHPEIFSCSHTKPKQKLLYLRSCSHTEILNFMQKDKKIRIKDIAERAGVSTGTIDRVLHNRGEVNAETRKKVLEIVEEMGYTPNLLARSLASKKTTRIVVLFPHPKDNNPYWQQPISGIEKGINELKDYNTQVQTITFTSTDEQSFISATEAILENLPNGVVFNPVFKEASLKFIQQLDEAEIPYMFYDINLQETNNIAYFGQDAYQSGKAAAKLMCNAASGSTKILVLNLANRKMVTHHLQKRAAGFIDFTKSCKNQNIEIESVDVDLLDEEEPQKTLQGIFASNTHITGIFAPSTRVFKVIDFFKSQPTRPMIIGYDMIDANIEGIQNNWIDYLICQKPEEQAYKAIMAMFSYLISGQIPQKVNYSPIDVIFKENLEFYKHH